MNLKSPLIENIEKLRLTHSKLVAGKGILQHCVLRPLSDRSCWLGLEVLGVLQLNAVLHKHIATALHVPD